MFITGRVMNDNFYIVSVGTVDSHIVVEAYDKEKEVRLVLRLN